MAVLLSSGAISLAEKGVDAIEPVEMFKKIRDACDAVVKAFESGDQGAVATAMEKFAATITELDLWK